MIISRQTWPVALCAALLLTLLAGTAAVYAAALSCSVCGRRIEGRYLRSGDQVFCSRECYRSTLPVCAACGKRIEHRVISFSGKPYCSRDCLETALPKCEICGKPLMTSVVINGHTFCRQHAEGPRCSKCHLPFVDGVELPDGRRVCDNCNHGLLMDRRDALPHYRRAQELVKEYTGLPSPSLPALRLIGTRQLYRLSHKVVPKNTVQQGIYQRRTETITHRSFFGGIQRRDTHVEERVFILYGLTVPEFISTAAHELTHDLLAEQFPGIAEDGPAWAEEGICQYVAAMVCRRKGFAEPLRKIEDAQDSEYGDGYRYFKRLAGDDNWPAVERWLGSADFADLPKTAPGADPQY